MDESTLKIALTALDTRWSSLEHWLWVCAFVVFSGVIVEILSVVWEYRAERRDFWRGIIHSPEKPSKPKFILELLGSTLIALGIFGELLVGIKMAKVETNMRDDTSQLVAIIDQKASSATQLAKGFESQIASANERVSNAEKATETLRAENLIPQTNMLKLREKMADRHLTPDQQRKVAGKLLGFPGQRLSIFMYLGDPEILGITNDIIAALGMPMPSGPRWTISACPEQPGRTIPGILVELRTADKAARDAAEALVLALKDEGLLIMGNPIPISFEFHSRPGGCQYDPSAPIVMTIGKKP